jgi:hypothetical protein
VRLAIGTSPSADATLSGTTVARIVNGVATFTDVRIDQVGQGYTLLAGPGVRDQRRFRRGGAGNAARLAESVTARRIGPGCGSWT